MRQPGNYGMELTYFRVSPYLPRSEFDVMFYTDPRNFIVMRRISG